jgi:hypothetical protein
MQLMMGDSTLVLFFITTLGRILGKIDTNKLGGWFTSMNIKIDI